MLNTYTVRPGDRIRRISDGLTFTVYRVGSPGEAGRSESAGPVIGAWLRPGGFGVTICHGSSPGCRPEDFMLA